MRKIIQKQLIELLNTVREGISYAVSTGSSISQSEGILVDCYSAFSHIGKTLSTNLSDDVFLEYKACIDEIHNELEVLNEVLHAEDDYKEIYDNLKTNINVFGEMIKNEQIRLEVVFLPYKASMWDSLESVWKAADEDKNCDAYVIPIPYYDRNPDFSLREEHYEGNLFPKYVPITHYEKYDFEKRRPDMIFIHNPYDKYNYITTVHPFFYTKNLKKFTDKLVYIPYFVLNEINPNDEQALKNLEHFVTIPGVLNSDKVIVQSENMRQAYINILMGLTENKEENRAVFEEKILGLGSPKFDRVLSTKKENTEIPEEWLNIIKKNDGSLKKVIFYNTSVTALLKYREKMLEKMRNVFKTFRENKNEVALLWRPHPLIEATIKSMRPQLWNDYKKLVDEYINEGWGIYDDTADLDRAITLSDAYYGDGSSVVQLFSKTHKPIMIQNVDV